MHTQTTAYKVSAPWPTRRVELASLFLSLLNVALQEIPAMSLAYAQFELKLNCDVLTLLVDILDDRKTLLSFMHTCRFTYAAGIQKLLSLPVSLSYKRDFASFCDFVLGHAEVRPSLIREISIDDASQVSTEHLLRRFLQVLELARNLQKFTMACGDNLSEAAIAGALASNTSIKSVTIASPNANTIAALRRWVSPVERAEVSLDESSLGGNENFKPALLDPTWVFASVRPTLQEITTHWAQSFSTGPSFPATKTLNVHSYYPVAMGDVARAFPNLSRLHVAFEQGFDAEELERERGRNSTIEERWESLDYVGGDIGSVFVLALACRVKHLDLTVPRRCHNPETLIATILEATRPPQLTMRFAVRSADLDHMPASLRAASASVTHLDITYHVPSSGTSVRNFIVR